MTSFLTGGGGFIGRAVARQLRARGGVVRALARATARRELGYAPRTLDEGLADLAASLRA